MTILEISKDKSRFSRFQPRLDKNFYNLAKAKAFLGAI